MKILCLHGYGTNVAVLENQLSKIVSILGSVEFHYLEGPVESPKAQGLGAFTTGPFWCYYDNFAPAAVQDAHDLITEFVEDEGPFDGILGFSQGASLAIGYLLRQDRQTNPFKFAVIFSSVIGFTSDPSYAAEILGSITDDEMEKLSAFPDVDLESISTNAKTLFEPMAKALSAGLEGGFLHAHPDKEAFQRHDYSRIPRILHPALTEQRIQIPTVHVVGRLDSPLMLEQSRLMFELCDPKTSTFFEHSAGHDIPRALEDAKIVSKAITAAAQEGETQSLLCRL